MEFFGAVSAFVLPFLVAILVHRAYRGAGHAWWKCFAAGVTTGALAFVVGAIVMGTYGEGGALWPVWLLVLGTVAAGMLLAKQGGDTKKPAARVHARAASAAKASPEPRQVDDRDIPLIELSDSSVQFMPHGRVPITIQGVTMEEGRPIMASLVGGGYPPAIKMQLGLLMARKNASSPEVDSFLSRAHKAFRAKRDEFLDEAGDLSAMTDEERRDVRQEAVEDAADDIGVCSMWEDFEVLLAGEPVDETADDELLNLFGDRLDLLELYLRLGKRKRDTVKTDSDEDRRRMLELCERGLAISSYDLDPADLLKSLRMAAIQEMLGTDAPKTFRRKAEAVEFAASVDGIVDRVSGYLPLEDTFRIVKRDDLEDAEAALRYAKEYAGLIVTTYITAQRARKAIDLKVSGEVAEVWPDDDCELCEKHEGKSVASTRSPAAPPHHVGCVCIVEVDEAD